MNVATARFALIALAFALTGCIGDVAMDAGVTITPVDEGLPTEYALELDLRPADLATGETEAEGLIAAPDEVSVFVGEELLVELALIDPTLGEVRPADLPSTAVFESAHADDVARVRWEPQLTDVGQHEFIFLVVDATDESLILGTSVLVVSVMPRHRFIEYGF